MKKSRIIVATLALIFFCSIFVGAHNSSAKVIDKINSISPYKYCGYHPKGIPHTVFLVGLTFNKKACGGRCEVIPKKVDGKKLKNAFLCNKPGAKCPTLSKIKGWSVKKYKETAAYRYYNVTLRVKDGYQGAVGKIKRKRKYSLKATPMFEVWYTKKDSNGNVVSRNKVYEGSLVGVCDTKEDKDTVYYGEKAKVKRRKDFSCDYDNDGKTEKFVFDGWAKTRDGKRSNKGETEYVVSKLKKGTKVYAWYKVEIDSDTPPTPNVGDCSGIDKPAKYNESFNTKGKRGWSRVISKVKDTAISSYSDWQDEIYTKPKDTVNWIHCYYPGVQVTAFTDVSEEHTEHTTDGDYHFPTNWISFYQLGNWSNEFNVDKSEVRHTNFYSPDYGAGKTAVQNNTDSYEVLMRDVSQTYKETSSTSPQEAQVYDEKKCTWGCHWREKDSRCGCAEWYPDWKDSEGKIHSGGCKTYGDCYVDKCDHEPRGYIGTYKNTTPWTDDAKIKIPYNFNNEVVIANGRNNSTGGVVGGNDEIDEDDEDNDDGDGYDDNDELPDEEEGDDESEWDDFTYEPGDGSVTETADTEDEQEAQNSESGDVGNEYGGNSDYSGDGVADEIVVAGETKQVYFDINTLTRYNRVTEGEYATRVDNAKWKVRVCFEGQCYYGPIHNAGNNGVLNDGESNTSYYEGSTWSSSVGIYIPDLPAGSIIEVGVGVYPKDSGEDKNLSSSYYDVNDENSWAYGTINYIIAKKPSLQVWGGNVFSDASIETSVMHKRDLRGYTDGMYQPEIGSSSLDNQNHIFGSWGELGVIATNSTRGFASGASTSKPGGTNELNFCNRVPLTIANTPCYNATTQPMGGMLTSGGLNDDRSKIIDKFVIKSGDGANLEIGDKEIGRTELNDGDLGLKMVDGNVYISGDISYVGNYKVLRNAPKMVIYSTRDVYIDCSVGRIDALVVAEGTVKTCADRYGNEPDINSGVRSKQLVVNGSVIASEVIPGRTYGAATGDNSLVPAEVFNFDPTLYLWSGDRMNASTDSYSAGVVDVKYMRELSPRL